MKKRTTWIRFRHRVVFGILRYPLTLYTILRYGVRVDRFRQQGNRPYLIIMNHQTAWDQFCNALGGIGQLTAAQVNWAKGKIPGDYCPSCKKMIIETDIVR